MGKFLPGRAGRLIWCEMRRFLRRLAWLAALLILGLLVWAGYYVCNHGFSRHWRVRVSQEFKRRGLDLYVHRLTLDPIQGLVAREVQIYDATDPDRVLATIDRVALDINLTNLLHSKPFLDAVDLRNADLSLPLNENDPRSERVKVSHLNARVIFPPHEWYVSQAEATIYGLQVSARGRLQNPEAYQGGENNEQRTAGGGSPGEVLDVLKQVETLHYSGAAPRVEINFGGDLADIRTLYADAVIWGENIKRGESGLTQVYAALSLRDKVIELKQCNLSDAKGELDVDASWNLDNGDVALQLRSTLDPGSITTLLKIPNPLDDFDFQAAPELELSGSGVLGGPRPGVSGLMVGHVGLDRFSYKGTAFTGAGADFSWNGARWYLRNGWLGNRTGQVNVRAISTPGDFRAQIDSSINPNSLRGLASGGVSDGLRDWDFVQAPKASLTITGTSADPAGWTTGGKIELGRTRMRGVPLNWGTATVQVKGAVFTYKDFIIQRDEGAATGTFSYDFAQHEAWLTDIHAHLNTTEAAIWIDPGLAKQLLPYRFKEPPTVTLDGFVQCANDKGTHLDVQVEAPGGMDYTFCKRTLTFPRISGHLFFGEHRIVLTDVAGILCSGTVQGSADISFGQDAQGYTASAQVKNMDFASLTKLYFNYNDSHGLMDGRFDFGGKNDDPWTLYGKGNVEVTEGNVFAIPVLGPFSGILNTMVPGMGYNVAHDGSATFAIKNGVITTRDFLVKGRGFNMIGDGRLFFLDDRLAFNIRLNAQGLPGVFLFPVSKLLEYAGTGTLEDPNWKPVLLEGRRQAAAAASPVPVEEEPTDAAPASTPLDQRWNDNAALAPRMGERDAGDVGRAGGRGHGGK
jgi:hypothetical protein